MYQLLLKELNFFTAFYYIYAYVGTSASPIALLHLLHTFCVPILLPGLEAAPISNANLATLQSTLNISLFKIFKVNDAVNLLLPTCNIVPTFYVSTICWILENLSSFLNKVLI